MLIKRCYNMNLFKMTAETRAISDVDKIKFPKAIM